MQCEIAALRLAGLASLSALVTRKEERGTGQTDCCVHQALARELVVGRSNLPTNCYPFTLGGICSRSSPNLNFGHSSAERRSYLAAPKLSQMQLVGCGRPIRPCAGQCLPADHGSTADHLTSCRGLLPSRASRVVYNRWEAFCLLRMFIGAIIASTGPASVCSDFPNTSYSTDFASNAVPCTAAEPS